jgi:single-strand selective monofunctional uracil DNA glycosylase
LEKFTRDRLMKELISSTQRLAKSLRGLEFSPPSAYVYRTLDYTWAAHQQYLERFGNGKKWVLFLGMNPGPFGMAQTGVPFGEVAVVRDWMQINAPIKRPEREHPKRPITGFACTRSEVSGRRLWGLFSERFPDPAHFFKDHFVLNYCPLIWMSETGANLTPDKLPASEMAPVEAACLKHLREVIELMDPDYLIGVGAFAEERLKRAHEGNGADRVIGKILHPSPASPAANRGWAEAASRQLNELGVW